MMTAMAAPKGRTKRRQAGAIAMHVKVDEDVRAVLDAVAAALGITVAAALELVVRHVEVDDELLPVWVRERIEQEQLPIDAAA